MSRFSELLTKVPVLGVGFWEPGLAAVPPACAGGFTSLPKHGVVCISVVKADIAREEKTNLMREMCFI